MNKYLRKIAAVLSLTIVLTSFDCTALRAVNTGEINAVSSDYDKLTKQGDANKTCLLYTSPSPRDISGSRMPSSA